MSYARRGPFVDVPVAQWGNPPAGAVPLDAGFFNHLEDGIAGAYNPAVTDGLLGQVLGDPGSQGAAAVRGLVGTTSGARPVGKGELVINVRDIGAKGDGVTDDTTAVQAALDAGGTVVFPAGTYRCSALAVKSGSTIVALGPVTIVHIATGGFAGAFPRAMLTARDQPAFKSPSATDRVVAADVARDITVTGPFTFDGAGAAVWGLQFVACDRVVVDGATVTSVKGALDLRAVRDAYFRMTAVATSDDGISVTDQNFAGGADRGISRRIVFDRCVVRNSCTSQGTGATDKAAFEIDDGPQQLVFLDCHALDNAGTGFKAHVHTTEYDVRQIRFVRCVSRGNVASPGSTDIVSGFALGQCPAGSTLGGINYEQCRSTGSALAFARLPGSQTGVVTDITITGGYWESLQAPTGRDFLQSSCLYVGKDFDRFRITGATLAGARDGFGVYTYATGGELTLTDVAIPDAYTPLYLAHTGGTVRLRGVSATPKPWISAQSTVCVYILADHLEVDGLILRADSGQYGSSLIRLIGVDFARLGVIVRNSAGAVGGNAMTVQDSGLIALTGSVITGFANGIAFAGTLTSMTSVGNVFKGCTAKYSSAPAALVDAGNTL